MGRDWAGRRLTVNYACPKPTRARAQSRYISSWLPQDVRCLPAGLMERERARPLGDDTALNLITFYYYDNHWTNMQLSERVKSTLPQLHALAHARTFPLVCVICATEKRSSHSYSCARGKTAALSSAR